MSRRDRREQRQRDRHQQRVEKHADKEERKRREAPQRIRSTATGCFAFGVLAILGGIFSAVGTPTFGGEAYTEIVQRLATLSGAVAWLAAVVLLVGAALLRALADILDEQRRQTMWRVSESLDAGE